LAEKVPPARCASVAPLHSSWTQTMDSPPSGPPPPLSTSFLVWSSFQVFSPVHRSQAVSPRNNPLLSFSISKTNPGFFFFFFFPFRWRGWRPGLFYSVWRKVLTHFPFPLFLLPPLFFFFVTRYRFCSPPRRLSPFASTVSPLPPPQSAFAVTGLFFRPEPVILFWCARFFFSRWTCKYVRQLMRDCVTVLCWSPL